MRCAPAVPEEKEFRSAAERAGVVTSAQEQPSLQTLCDNPKMRELVMQDLTAKVSASPSAAVPRFPGP